MSALVDEDVAVRSDEDGIAEEVPVALSYNGISHAVMMATPQDLDDFAIGFSLTERIVERPDDILDTASARTPRGIVVSVSIPSDRAAALGARRRSLAGRTGCGLCGVESLAAILPAPPRVRASPHLDGDAIRRAVASLPTHQALRRRGHAVHAAAWADLSGDILVAREDVGRHNALDKLIGAVATAGSDPACGFALITSRCSYEMAQKAATVGIGALVAMAAPTRLAIEVARAARLTLITSARGSGYVPCAGVPDRCVAA